MSDSLANFSRSEVESHNSPKSCYVTVGANVYDVTDFLDSHPGGDDLILQYAGQDVAAILQDESSHLHSEAAYEVLNDSLVGFVASERSPGEKRRNSGESTAVESSQTNGNGVSIHPRTGMACEEDLSKETDYAKDYMQHHFLDLGRPLIPQVWYGGFSKKFYLDQVHRPRHYKGGQSAPLFGNFLEPLTKTPWWLIPILWLPAISSGVYVASPGFSSGFVQAGFLCIGLFIWTLVEYALHRFLFHLDEYLPDNRCGITLHFLLHGVHHYLPMDRYRLVMPPTLFLALAIPFWKLAHTLFFWDWSIATTIYCGGVFGYVCYDLTHYFLHHRNLPLYFRSLKKYHLAHHFLDYELGFGVTSKLWDTVFGTELRTTPVVKAS